MSILLERLYTLLPLIEMDLENAEKWNYLHVTYEHPHVKRLWRQYGEERVFLHEISPVPAGGEALLHHHPWPSAALVIRGGYEMEIKVEGIMAARTWIHEGSAYEMLDPKSQHSVRPRSTVLTIMITGSPFEEPLGNPKPSDPGQRISAGTPTEDVLDFIHLWKHVFNGCLYSRPQELLLGAVR